MKYLLYFFLFVFFYQLDGCAQKKIVVIITSYNNAAWYEQNLNSVFSQKYDNYRVIFMDDCSQDGTADLVEAYIKKNKLEQKVILIKNDQWLSQMANHYNAVHMCEDDEIVVHLDGDDWLADENVLSFLNKIYSTQNVWLTYGQFKKWPSDTMGFVRATSKNVIQKNSFRQSKWVYMHLRSFYAGLFKQIKLQDLLMCGTFKLISPCPDVAFMYPMLEMAGKHIRFIHKVLYIYNTKNPLSQKNIYQKILENRIRRLKKYTTVANYKRPKDTSESIVKKIPLVVFNKKNTGYLESLLKSCKHYAQEITEIYVVHDQAKVGNKYKQLQHTYPKLTLVHYQDNNKFVNFLTSLNAEYVLFANDNVVIKDNLNLDNCIKQLITTDAYAFCLSLSEEQMKKDENLSTVYSPISDDLAALHSDYAHCIWQEVVSVDELKKWLRVNCKSKVIKFLETKNDFVKSLILFRSKDIIERFTNSTIHLFDECSITWKNFDDVYMMQQRRLWLFYRHAKVILQ